MRTAVGIIGAGPAGLMLGHLLGLEGIDSVIIEHRTDTYVTERVRAGVLEQGTVDLMNASGLGARLGARGLRHEGISLAFGGERYRIDFGDLTGGRGITIYGQNEVVRDLIDARRQSGRPLLFEVEDVTLHGIESTSPVIRCRHAQAPLEIHCEVIAGCDGFHGVSRASIPAGRLRTYEHVYPFAWLGILADAAPSSDELVYSRHERGFALFSMRSPSVTRLYLQCRPDERLEDWPDDRIWSELRLRLSTRDGWAPLEGPITQKGVTGMRSFVVEPMRVGRLLLAGDAAHIVPPTGAKGLNLAMADVYRLARAIARASAGRGDREYDAYSDSQVRRAWRAQRFSWWMTSLLHRMETADAFDERRQRADLEYLVGSRAAMTSLAENYVGWPFD
jgi:p-hydroxybenzoate 3-monooxygenase